MRTLLALCLVALITATTGGGFAFAQTMTGGSATDGLITNGSVTAEYPVVELTSSAADHCVYMSALSPSAQPMAMPGTPSAPCAQDCNGLLPCAVGHTGDKQPKAIGQATALLLALAQTFQLPPPRA